MSNKEERDFFDSILRTIRVSGGRKKVNLRLGSKKSGFLVRGTKKGKKIKWNSVTNLKTKKGIKVKNPEYR